MNIEPFFDLGTFTLTYVVYDRKTRDAVVIDPVLDYDAYQPNGRALRWETTIGASKEANVQLRASTTREEFVKHRAERDARLTAPRLLFPSVQVNIDAGRLPTRRADGRRYLTIPLDMNRPSEDDGTPVGHAISAST